MLANLKKSCKRGDRLIARVTSIRRVDVISQSCDLIEFRASGSIMHRRGGCFDCAKNADSMGIPFERVGKTVFYEPLSNR